MNTIIINDTVCVGCKTCYKACFVDVFRWDEEAKRPIVAYPEDCVQCTWCEVACKLRALKVIPDYDNYPFPREAVTTKIV